MKGPKPSPLKFLTPSQLVMCLILFFLPWVEVQCAFPKASASMQSLEKMDPADVVWAGVLQQSGIEITLGQVTYADQTKQASIEKSSKAAKESGPGGAHLLWLYLLALLAGIGLGFALPVGKARKPALAGCCALALLVAGGQATMGLPVMKGLEAQAEGMMGSKKDKESLDDIVRLKYKFPFYLSMFLLVGALGTALLEPGAATGPPPRPKDEEEPEEDEEEAPRRKRRR
jgi:hypothetical protein